MAATPFKVISWSPNEPITDEKLDAMVSNDNWLKQNMVTGLYGAYSKRRDEGVRITSGLVLITSRRQATASANVNFGGFFSPGCRPVVTTGIISKGQRRIFLTIDGPGTELHPTPQGFQVHVEIDAAKKAYLKIKRNFYVTWAAMGF